MHYTKKMLNEVAQWIDTGQICYINADTMEMETVIDYDNGRFTVIDGPMEEDIEILKKVSEWQHCIKITPLESRESFRIMQEFAEDYMPEGREQQILVGALSRRHPFSNFNGIIHDSPFREDWFRFKQEWLEEYVKEILENTTPIQYLMLDLYDDSEEEDNDL